MGTAGVGRRKNTTISQKRRASFRPIKPPTIIKSTTGGEGVTDMNATAGLWIDHRKAVIAIVSADGETTLEIKSNVDKQPGRLAGVRSTAPYESQLVKADDRLERKLSAHLNQYYAKVIAALRKTDAILIFGPGEAKGELKKRLARSKVGGHITVTETTSKLTDRQIAAKALKYFHETNATPTPGRVPGSRKPRRNTRARAV